MCLVSDKIVASTLLICGWLMFSKNVPNGALLAILSISLSTSRSHIDIFKDTTIALINYCFDTMLEAKMDL